MGHSSKKKKRSGNSRNRGRAGPKDQSAAHDQDLLSEELTALAAIFQEDFKIVSEPPHPQFTITLRPYSNDMGFEDLNISAFLSVRCTPGYPYKCPKLQVVPEKGLSKKDADQLFSLLFDQANIYAREGRVMIFNLVEAAQEFLSEIAPVEQSLKSVSCLGPNGKDQPTKDATVQHDKIHHPAAPSVHSLIDLYSDLCGDDATWGGHDSKVANDNSSGIFRARTGFSEKRKGKTILLRRHTSADIERVIVDYSSHQDKLTPERLSMKQVTPQTVKKLQIVAEEVDDDSINASTRLSDQQSVGDTSESSDNAVEKDVNLGDEISNVDSFESFYTEEESLASPSFASPAHDIESQSKKKDLLLVHLLHLACSSKESLANALPDISLELYNTGMLSEWAKDLVAESPSAFSKAFHVAFEQNMSSSCFTQFWNTDDMKNAANASFKPNSRYLNDFEEIRSLGHGGFGHVTLCKNKLDGRQYAVKRIRLKDKDLHVNEKILREVATLSRLQHQHVVRYYQAWCETEYGNHERDAVLGSRTIESSSCSHVGTSSTYAAGDSGKESTYLYIQMECCHRTLRQEFESYTSSFDKDYAWHLFRQIVEGLAHIHSQGIIHRDLTPSNIFFDVREDIKIGDFGLAKFLKLEQLDHDQYFPTDTIGASVDGTGQVGTYFYTAPEIEHRWPQINEKVDMYSLGVIFFELWHPFATAMERHIVLSDLKQKGSLPPHWVAKFPSQSTLLRRLMSASPSDRPSATDLLQHELPPRMEDEWLNDILRTIQTPEDTYVYDRVVSTIFDEERLIRKAHRQHSGSTKMTRDESCFTQYPELDTELRDVVIEVSKEIFKLHCAKRLEISPMRVLDGCYPSDRNTVKLLTQGGDMLELCHELRTPFVNWIVKNQKLSFKRYEISSVYRRAIGHSTPRRFLQGDFDIIGGAPPVTEAEVIKVVVDVATQFFPSNIIDIRLNHGQVLESIWSWVGIGNELRQNVAELLSLVNSSSPQSTNRKTKWSLIRRQLIQDLNISEAVVDRLQTADLRFCGSADQALARLRGALPPVTHKALEEMSTLLNFLRVWSIEQHISVDVLMPPAENYYRDLFFQIYSKESGLGSVSEATLLAVGGRYDSLVNQLWDHEYKSNPPGAVGISVALEKFVHHSSIDSRPSRIEPSISVLICSRGGGGLLNERMEFVAELWQANIKAEYVPRSDPSLKEQYEYASENDIKCLVIITDAGLSQTGLVKVRHLDLKKEKEVERGEIVKFLTDAISTQFRNLAIWN